MLNFIIIAAAVAVVLLFYLARLRWRRWVPSNPDVRIAIYSRPGCSACDSLRAALKNNRIPFDYFYIDDNSEGVEEMWRIVHKTPGMEAQPLSLPIIIFGDKVLVSPDFPELAELYGKRKWVFTEL